MLVLVLVLVLLQVPSIVTIEIVIECIEGIFIIEGIIEEGGTGTGTERVIGIGEIVKNEERGRESDQINQLAAMVVIRGT